MPEILLPLFPLQLVLLPGETISLHIFEDRYKEMITESLRERSEFGIVLAREQGILNIGCTAKVDELVRQYDDGRMDIRVIGRRRFEIHRLNEERGFVRAAITLFDDEGETSSSSEVRAMVFAAWTMLLETGAVESPDVQATDPLLSFRIASYLPDLQLRQAMLASRSEHDRLQQLREYLPDLVARTRRLLHVKRISATNGHGGAGVQEEP